MVTIPPIEIYSYQTKQIHRPAHHLRQSWKEIPDSNTKIVIFVYILSLHQLQTNTEMIILRSQPSFLVIILLVTTLHTPQAICGFNNTQLSSLPRIFSILQISAASKNAVIHPQRLRTIRQPHERYLNTFVKRPQNKISDKITDTLLSTRNTTIRQKTDTPIANPGAETQRLLRGTGAVAHTFFRTMATTVGATSGLIAVGLGMGWLGINKERKITITLPEVSLPSCTSNDYGLTIHGDVADDFPYIYDTIEAIEHQPPEHISKQLVLDMKEQYLARGEDSNPLIDKLPYKRTRSTSIIKKDPSFPLQGFWRVPPLLHIPEHIVTIEHFDNKYLMSLNFDDWSHSTYTLGTLHPDPDNAHQAWGVLPLFSDLSNYSTLHPYYVFMQIKTDNSGNESLSLEYYNKDGTQTVHYEWPGV